MDFIYENKSIVAVFNTHTEAEEGLTLLQEAGFDTGKLSIVGNSSHFGESLVGNNYTGDHNNVGGKPCIGTI
jgi:hypothetical protein